MGCCGVGKLKILAPSCVRQVPVALVWDSVYDNTTNPGKRRGLTSLQDHMVPVLHWARMIMIITCNIIELYMLA